MRLTHSTLHGKAARTLQTGTLSGHSYGDRDLDSVGSIPPGYLGGAETALEFHGHILFQVVHPLVLQVLQSHLATQLGHFL